MEFIQTLLAQIEAAKIDEASRPQGLLDELDEHRSFLQQQPGFQDMRVTRSINREGNVLLVVETRWQDDDSLLRYETQEPNVMSIFNMHQELIIPNSLQVLDMEGLRTEAWRGLADPTRAAQERLALPLLIPLGVLAFALLVIYGLSRIYLELPGDVATGLAAGIALGILAMAWFLASRPTISGWQIGSIATVAAAVLAGGAIFALVHEDGGETAAVSEPGASPTPAASPGPGAAPGGPLVTMGDNFFESEGEQEPAIQVSVGEDITFNLSNNGLAPHNMHIAGTDNDYGVNFCQVGGDEPCSDPNRQASGESATITFRFDQPGTFIFRCDFHPQEMTGTIEVVG